MKLNHNPTDMDDGFAEGIYSYRVLDIEMRNADSPKGPWSSGNDGMTVIVEAYGDGVSFNSWENFTFTARALYKFRELCESAGLDFHDENLDTEDLIGKSGKAAFARKEGSKFLNVDYWISEEEAKASKPAAKKKSTKKKKVVQDEVPF